MKIWSKPFVACLSYGLEKTDFQGDFRGKLVQKRARCFEPIYEKMAGQNLLKSGYVIEEKISFRLMYGMTELKRCMYDRHAFKVGKFYISHKATMK